MSGVIRYLFGRRVSALHFAKPVSRTSDLKQLMVDVKAERDAQAAQHVGYRFDTLNFKSAKADPDEAAPAERIEAGQVQIVFCGLR